MATASLGRRTGRGPRASAAVREHGARSVRSPAGRPVRRHGDHRRNWEPDKVALAAAAQSGRSHCTASEATGAAESEYVSPLGQEAGPAGSASRSQAAAAAARPGLRVGSPPPGPSRLSHWQPGEGLCPALLTGTPRRLCASGDRIRRRRVTESVSVTASVRVRTQSGHGVSPSQDGATATRRASLSGAPACAGDGRAVTDWPPTRRTAADARDARRSRPGTVTAALTMAAALSDWPGIPTRRRKYRPAGPPGRRPGRRASGTWPPAACGRDENRGS